MTITQLYLFNVLYLAIFLAVALLTRAKLRRIVGAVAGATVFSVVALGIIALGEHLGWWHFVFYREPYYVVLMWIGFALAGFVYLITWRIARRFGWRGLAVVLIVVAVIGPFRDSWYMRHFPEWGSYGPGPAPMLAVSATYIIMIVVGHSIMRLIAGPARGDSLAEPIWRRRG